MALVQTLGPPPITDGVRAILGRDIDILEDDGPMDRGFENDRAFQRTLEVLNSVRVLVFKLQGEQQQRVVSYASQEFGRPAADGVQGAAELLPVLRAWAARLESRLTSRGALPLEGTKLAPRFVRVCEVYGLDTTERKLLGALLCLRTSHAFGSVKLTGHMSYGTASGSFGTGNKPGVTLCSVLSASLSELAAFQKPERRHVKQAVVLPGSQLLTELPAIQHEMVS